MEIQTIYRIAIYYDFTEYDDTNVDGIHRVSDKLNELSKNNSVDVCENCIGGPCFGPYFIAESESLKNMEKFKRQALAYLRKWKKLKIC